MTRSFNPPEPYSLPRYGACFVPATAWRGAKKLNPIFEQKTRDGEIARALNMALHALCVHSGARIIMEGESVTLNFTREAAAIIRALQLLGGSTRRDAPGTGFRSIRLTQKEYPGALASGIEEICCSQRSWPCPDTAVPCRWATSRCIHSCSPLQTAQDLDGTTTLAFWER
jgi:hypothetical protein